MKIHVLPGDSLVESFEKTRIEGEVVVCRECLVDGPVAAPDLAAFWEVRKQFLMSNYGGVEGDYQSKFVDEMNRLLELAKIGEVYLWFEYELFCQVNFWFCVWFLRNSGAKLHVVYPKFENEEDIWKGFGYLDEEELTESYDRARELSPDDLSLAVELWEAFQNRDFERLGKLGKSKSVCFPTLKEVTAAACEIETQPLESLRTIIAGGTTEFGHVFQQFCKNEAVYGFGDLQVKKLFDGLIEN